MTNAILTNHPLHRWFAGLVQDAMYTGVGLADPAVVDYLAELLTEFIHTDRIFVLHDENGRPINQVTDMLAATVHDATLSSAARDRIVHRHIGDFTLFWTGIYPENLKRLCARDRKDHFIDYFRQGKRSYAIASELSAESTRPAASLLRRLSDCFEFCVHGLGIVRQEVRTCAAETSDRRPDWPH
jgi:hypothetical protein